MISQKTYQTIKKIKDWMDLHIIMLNNKLESSTSTLYI